MPHIPEREAITTIKDPRVIEARDLSSAGGRARRQKCLLEGEESIQWALEASLPVEYVLYHQAIVREPFLVALQKKQIPCYAVTDGILKKVSGTSYLIPYIGVAQLARKGSVDDMGELVVVLDRVVDHGNIGTIIRTASAFGVRNIVSTSSDLDLYFKKIITASRGRVFDVRLERFSSAFEAIRDLKQKGYQVVATSPHARDIQALAPLQPKPVALIVGNETDGIADEIVQLADVVVQIPMSGQVESLNVGVATGISLYELKFRMVLNMLTRYIRATFGREVNVTSKMIMMAFDAQIRNVSDLNALQVLLLMILECDQVMTMPQVAKDLGVFGQELETLLEPLFEKVYIQAIPASDEQQIKLTDEGKRTLAQLWNVVERANDRVLSGFSESEKQQLADFLRRIQANCTAIVNE